MLQFIAKENERYSVPEQVQMAVEGGCRWVVLGMPGATDSEIRDVAREIIPLCKEEQTLLTIENHAELAKELGIHGMVLTDPEIDFAKTREFCGPEAIIGVTAYSAEEALSLKDADVDYIAFPYDLGLSEIQKSVDVLRSAGVLIPLVATGDYPLDEIDALMAAGVSGLAINVTIADSGDPVAVTREITNILSKYQKKVI